MVRYRLVVPAVAVALIVSSGCKKTETTASAPATDTSATVVAVESTTPAASPAAAAPARAPGTVIASTEYREDSNIRADLLEVKRVSGGALYVKWRVTNATPPPQQAGLTASSEAKPINYTYGWDDLYYVDPAENKKYEYLKDSEGNRILDIWYGNLAPGESKTSWAKFPAPPPTSTKISLTLPRFSPLEDVPITQ